MPEYNAKFNCPGCGSALQTPEGSISLKCAYCGQVMRIGSPGRILKYYFESRLDRFGVKFATEKYLKENNISLQFSEITQQLYYMPFYRFRGMTYSIFTEKTEIEMESEQDIPLPPKIKYFHKCRNLDLTVPGISIKDIGLDSLGIRPEVVPLTALVKGELPADSIFMDVDTSSEDAIRYSMGLNYFNLGFTNGKEELVESEMVGEGLSLIYYPVVAYIVQRGNQISTVFIDGLAKRVFNEIPGEFSIKTEGKDVSQSSYLIPVQHKCPNCGYDLPVSENSLFYHCSNCQHSYTVADDKYLTTTMLTAKFEESTNYYPFWRLPISFGNISLVKHFAKYLTGEIPLIAKQKAENKFYIYVPAFKTADLKSLAQKAISICCIQPILELSKESKPPAADMLLPEKEAREMGRFVWNAIRFKYKQISGEQYELKTENSEGAELVWMTLAMPAKLPRQSRENISNNVSR